MRRSVVHKNIQQDKDYDFFFLVQVFEMSGIFSHIHDQILMNKVTYLRQMEFIYQLDESISILRDILYVNSRETDQTLHSVASDLSLHCLHMSHKKDTRLIWAAP